MAGRRFLAAAGVVVSLALAATPVAAAPAVGTQFSGLWVGTDTADGSTQVLQVSAGQSPSVVYQDFYASSCEEHGSRSTHWVSAGRGWVDGSYLVIEFHKSGCGSFSIGAYVDFYEYDAGSDTLTDSWGNVYSRA